MHDTDRNLAKRPPRRALAWAGLLLAVAVASAAQPIATLRVADGLAAPSFVVAPFEDFARLFILESGGDVLVMDLTTGVIAPTPFLTVPAIGEGLQGLAFHPSYGSNGYVYVHYFAGPSRSLVERYTRDPANPDRVDPSSKLQIIAIDQPFDNHNGGWIGFGPDGYLYYPQGDGGSGCDPLDHGQDLGTLLGSLLRLDVDGDDFPADPARNYAIPPDNPFVGVAGRDEIWAYGLRNPFRASFDRQTGDLYIADVGQNVREEINFQTKASAGGQNYGWKLREGTIATPNCGGGADLPGRTDPVYDYQHGSGEDQGNSVTGGYVYRGPGEDLQGLYFFADYVNDRIWSIDAVTGGDFTDWTAQLAPDVGTIEDVVGFGEDGAGHLYIVDLNGEVFRVVGPFPFVPCPDLVLADDLVLGDRIEEHCRNIAVGPAFRVGDGGDLTLRAGNRVGLFDGAMVAADGLLAVDTDPGLQATPP